MKINILESVENILTMDGTRLEDLYERYGVTRYRWRSALHADKGHDEELRKTLLSDALRAVPDSLNIINKNSVYVKESENKISKELKLC